MWVFCISRIFVNLITDCRRPKSARPARGGSRSPGETQISFLFSHKNLHKRRINHIPKTIAGVLSILFHIFAQSDINIEVTPWPQMCSQTSWAVSGQKWEEAELPTKPEVILKRKCHWSLQGTHCVISADVLRSPLIVRLWHCSRPSWPAQVRSNFTSQSIRPYQ